MVAINKKKVEPKTQPGLVNMFFGDVICPYCKKIYFTSIFYDVTQGRKICKKCKRIYEITRPVAVACNRINRNTRNKN